ncbi:MAG: nucleoside triphosphate pyrophosphohydrolase [Clostridia bacterium]
MKTVTIAPISTKNNMTFAIDEVISGAKMLFVQTFAHPAVKAFLDKLKNAVSMDDIYESSDNFDELNRKIALRILGETEIERNTDCVFVVLGRSVSRELMSVFNELGGQFAEFILLPSAGFAEAAAGLKENSVQFSSCAVYSAHDIPETIDLHFPVAFSEVDTQITAGELKLALSLFIDDDDFIVFSDMDESGEYFSEKIRLYELDRQPSYSASSVVLAKASDYLFTVKNDLQDLKKIMTRLRGDGGCPWDREQTHLSLIPALIEESYEVVDAIRENDVEALLEELGDLLLQIVFHAQIEAEHSNFDMLDVTTGIVKKLIYRHPHVFADVSVANSNEVLKNWELLKQSEKAQKTVTDTLNAVPKSFPSLMRAAKIQKRASRIGFDWNNAKDAYFKIGEEANELFSAIEGNEGDERIKSELGDLLFSVVNVSRLLKIDPELALGDAVDKFVKRFSKMEAAILKDSLSLEKMSLNEMDVYWERVKNTSERKK